MVAAVGEDSSSAAGMAVAVVTGDAVGPAAGMTMVGVITGGIVAVKVGLETAAGLPSITRTLLERGYSREDIGKILGGNLLRVFEAVQASG